MSIKLENLQKEYHLADGTLVRAVNGVSLEIPSNTIYGIIGKSGAGKSTLVRLISLLERPDNGAVWYDDKRVDNLSKYDLIEQRRHAGMIFQNFNLFSSRTAAGNIAYPLEICKTPKDKIKTRVEELLELVGLGGRGDAKISSLSIRRSFPADKSSASPSPAPLPTIPAFFFATRPQAPLTRKRRARFWT